MTSIHKCCYECKISFERLIESLKSPERHFGDQIPAKGVINEYGRFKVWSGSVGANHPPEKGASLDYRLDDAQFYKEKIVDLISRLESTLQKASQLLLKERLPFEEEEGDEIEQLSDPESDNMSTLVSIDVPVPREAFRQPSDTIHSNLAFTNQQGPATANAEESRRGHRKEMPQLYEYIQDLVQNLYSMARIIRQPIAIDRLSKAAKIPVEHFREFDQQHIDECFPNATPILKARMTRAIARRRQLLRYNELHHRKLSELQTNATITSSRIESEGPSQQSHVNYHKEGLPSKAHEISFQAPSLVDKSVLASTVATKFMRPAADVERGSDTQSEDGTISSFNYSQGGNEKIQLPARPLDDDGNELVDFLCHLCFHLVRIRTGKAWAKHIYKDLQAYICTFDRCKEPDRMFETRNEWIQHEYDHHRREWACNTSGHVTYRSKTDFVDHVRGHHSPEASNDQLNSLIKLCERPILTGEVSCPLCTDNDNQSVEGRALQEEAPKADKPLKIGSNQSSMLREPDGSFTDSQGSGRILTWISSLPGNYESMASQDVTTLPTLTRAKPDNWQVSQRKIDPKRIKYHIAPHLERIALFALVPSQGSVGDKQSVPTGDADPGSDSSYLSFASSSFMSRTSSNTAENREIDTRDMDTYLNDIGERIWTQLTEGVVKGIHASVHDSKESSDGEEHVPTNSDSGDWVPLSIVQNVMPLMLEALAKGGKTRARGHRLRRFVRRASRLCALLFHINRPEWFDLFYEQDFDDEMFPITLDTQRIEGSSKVSFTIRALRTEAKIEKPKKSVNMTVSKWRGDEASIIRLLDHEQWRFFVPVFRRDSLSSSLWNTCRLPFIREIKDSLTTTNLSIVRRFVIHHSHLAFESKDQIGYVVDGDKNPHVAVKELLSAQSLSQATFDEIVDNEEAVLSHFQNQDHGHFIKTIARYSQGERHFFVFPWANGGNLRNFWNIQLSLSDACLSFSPDDWTQYIRWFFHQLLGLTEAMKNLHHPRDNPGGSCRHGDLKPENILCFCKTVPGPGKIPTDIRLVIADAGHANFHQKATELRGKKTSTAAGAEFYSPPEVHTKTDEPRSKLYDIWSLGCLYLEFLIWILYGNEGLQRFDDDVGRVLPYTFYRLQPTVSVKPEVLWWIEKIKGDKRCTPISSTAVGRLVDVIEKRLLVVNVPTYSTKGLVPSSIEGRAPKRTDQPEFFHLVREATEGPNMASFSIRANAEELYREMENIVQSAEGKHQQPLSWINWDGMAHASEIGIPQLMDNLTLGRRGSQGTTKEQGPVKRTSEA